MQIESRSKQLINSDMTYVKKVNNREQQNESYCIQALTLIEYAIQANCKGVRNYSTVAQWLNVPNSSITRWQRGVGFPDLYCHFKLAQLIGVGYEDYFRFIRDEITLEELLECNFTMETIKQEENQKELMALLVSYISCLDVKRSLSLHERLSSHIHEELEYILS